MKKTISLIICLILVIFIISCERKEYSEKGIKEIVEDINVKLEKAVGEEFNWGSPGAYSIFRAYFSGEELIFINESYTYRAPTEASNRYYFKDGNMLHLISKKLDYTGNNESGKGKKAMIKMSFLQTRMKIFYFMIN